MRLINNSVYLKIPTFDELSYTEKLLACPKTMAFNKKWGGTVSFPKEKWQSFFDRYLTEESKNIYFHIYNLDNVFVGEVSSRYIDSDDVYMLNIKVKHEFRGNNHAWDALEIYIDYLFNEKDAHTIIDDVAKDNEGAIHLLTKFGFKVVEETEEVTLLKLVKNEG